MKKIFPIYFPTTVYLVDDDLIYLKSILSSLNKENAVYKLFTNPHEVLKNLEHQSISKLMGGTKIISYPEEGRVNHRTIDINISIIHEQIYEKSRFNKVSVLVVDQEMPGMQGLELCEKLFGSGIKIIMLTGEASNEFAVSAFNKGIIHKFINKNDPQLQKLLNQAIFEMQEKYFEDSSSIILDSLTKNTKHHPVTCIDDPQFIEYFHSLCKEKNLMEYYLCSGDGSFLFLDFKGNPTLLAVKDETEMQSTLYISDLSKQSDRPSKNTLEGLKARKKILYLHSENDYSLTPFEWEKKGYFHSSQVIEGVKDTFYISYLEDLKNYEINKQDIFSFYDFVEKRE